MRIGIFFGGQSREREISFAGGRTVYDNLDKNLFEAVPVFVDSLGNFILLNWEFIYKGTVRDFYPPVSSLPATENGFQIYAESLEQTPEETEAMIAEVGKRLQPSDFASLFDFAFLAMHGPYGEDGNIQGILEWYNIPYSGSGILPSAVGINKLVQKSLMEQAGFRRPQHRMLNRVEWLQTTDKAALLKRYAAELGMPLVFKAPYQGSSIGVSILKEENAEAFELAINKSLFIQQIRKDYWTSLSGEEKVTFLRTLTDIREGIGMPVIINSLAAERDQRVINHPEELLQFLNSNEWNDTVLLESMDGEETVLIESFIKGKEFSCIVIQDEKGEPIALPPTEIVKTQSVFDYRSKYLPGMTRKVTPINIESAKIDEIKEQCCSLFRKLHFNVYARLDGFISESGEIFLNDPNTTSGMLPSSFFFHQAAEIGMNPSQFLTYIIRTSLAERIKSGKKITHLRNQLRWLDERLLELKNTVAERTKVAVLMGGFSSERHISVESGRNIYEKLASSTKYEPFPVFLTGHAEDHELYLIPINIMLKDNADDIKEKVHAAKEPTHEAVKKIIEEARQITDKYVANPIMKARRIGYEELSSMTDAVFIALHGRPGEDGAVQKELEKYGVPYNGSGIESSQITINKYDTNKLLREHGVSVAKHRLLHKTDWKRDQQALIEEVEREFPYPFIAKPADDGCSSAVKKVKNRQELIAFTNQIFREGDALLTEEAGVLKLKANEEFPCKLSYLIEELIDRKGAKHFLEVTGGLLTKVDEQGNRVYEIFEPSETLASGEVLSLEEKFLAGEGQNITPARFARTKEEHKVISQQVRDELKRVAKILNIEGYARIDAFVRIFDDNKAETIIIEINSLPGMTPATCIFHQCAINGYKPYHFIDAILEYGKHKKKDMAQS
jgi:UDP-N-acetylmuramate--alanine ligase